MATPTALLAEMKQSMPHRDENRYRVRVGMATCGISAGADEVHDAFIRAVEEAGLSNVDVIPTGCVGRCDLEPMAEVMRGNEPPVLYIHLDPDKAKRIVQEHLVEDNVVDEFVG